MGDGHTNGGGYGDDNTGGVGENSRELRQTVCSGLEFMGVEFDDAANDVRGENRILSKPTSRVKVAVIATDEELMIATDTYKLVNHLPLD